MVIVITGLVMLFLFAHGLGVLALVTSVAAALIWYRRDVRRHPRVRCRMCAGGGDSRSRLGGKGWFRRPFGDCWCCGGRKAHPRLAARFLDPEGYRKIRAEIERGRTKI
jgi:hypothetical protein